MSWWLTVFRFRFLILSFLLSFLFLFPFLFLFLLSSCSCSRSCSCYRACRSYSLMPVVPIALVVLLLLLLLLVHLPNSSPLNQKIFPKRIYTLYTFSIYDHLISHSCILFSPTHSTYNLSAIQFSIQISSALNSIHLFHDVKTLSLSTSYYQLPFS